MMNSYPTRVLTLIRYNTKLVLASALALFILFSDFANAQTVVPITTNGTWTVPANVTSATFYIWGGGGGGGGVSSAPTHYGNGGGGGGSACGYVTITVYPGDVYTATLGAGGTAGTGVGTDGGQGGTTTFTRTTTQSGSNGAAGPWTVAGGFGGISAATTSGGTANGGAGGGAATVSGSGIAYFIGGNGSQGYNNTVNAATNTKAGYGGGAGGSGAAGSGAATVSTQVACQSAYAGGTGTYPGGAGGANATCGTAGDQTQTYPGAQPGGGGAGSWAYTAAETGGAGGLGQVTVVYTPNPSFTIAASSIAFPTDLCYTCTGSPSAVQAFTFSGANFSTATGNITVTPPAGYQIATTNTGSTTWSTNGSPLVIAYTGSALGSTTIYVRLVPTSAATFSGNITFSGGGVSSPPSIAVSGTAVSCANTGGSTNINTNDGVNWVGANQQSAGPGFIEPTNNSGSVFNLKPRLVAVTSSGLPTTDGRLQWVTTLNSQSGGAGDVYNVNMNNTGGATGGFLLTSAGGCGSAGLFNNKWGSSGGGTFASSTKNTVNTSTFGSSSANAGLDMSVAGYYTFVMKDNIYATTGLYIGYTAAKPVAIIHTPATQRAYTCNGLTISATLSVAPSSGELVYLRYKTNSSSSTAADFSGSNSGTTVVAMTQVGSTTTYTYTIASGSLTVNNYVDYYVFTTTDAGITGAISEGDKSYRLLNYDDNSGALYSYQIPATGPTATWAGGASGSWAVAASWSPAVVPCSGSNVVFNTPAAITVTNVPTISLSSISVSGTAVTLQPATGNVTVTLSNSGTALSIPSGASLILNPTTTSSLTLAYSGAGNTATIAGTLTLNPTSSTAATYAAANSTTTISGILNLTSGGTGAATYTATTGTTSISGTLNINDSKGIFTSTAANTTVTATGIVNMAGNASAIPIVTWTAGTLPAGATLTLAGSATTFTNLSQSFINLTVNTSTIAAAINFASGLLPSSGGTAIAGTLTVANTWNGTTIYGVQLITTAQTVNIANIAVNNANGFLIIGNGTAAGVVNMTGNVSITAGEMLVSFGGSAGGSYTINLTGTSSTFNNGGLLVMSQYNTASALNLTGASSSFTNTGNIYMNNSTAASTSFATTPVITVAGSFNMSAGTINWTKVTAGNSAGIINVAGTYNFTGGTISSTKVPNFPGVINFNGTTQAITSTAPTTLRYTTFRVLAGTSTLTTNNFIIEDAGGSIADSFVVYSGATLNMGTLNVNDNSPNLSGGGYAYFVNNGTLILGDPYGITTGSVTSSNYTTAGNVQTYYVTFGNASSCNYTYSGATGQATGNGLPSSLAGTLKVNMAATPAILNLTQSTTVTGTLALTQGIMSLGTGINLTNNGALTGGTSSTSYILTNSTGSYKAPTSTTLSTLLPLGTSDAPNASTTPTNYYTPLTIGSTSGVVTLTSSVLGGTLNVPSSATASACLVNLAWNVIASGATSANVTFGWQAGDDSATFSPSSAVDLGVYSGTYAITTLGTPTGLGTGVSPYTVTASSLAIPTASNKWVLGNAGCIVAGPSKYVITSVPGTGAGTATTGVAVATITVQAQTLAGALSTGYTGSITLTYVSGGTNSSNMTGTLTATAVNGVATFSNVAFNLAGTYTIKATGTLTASPTSNNIVISDPSTNIYGGDGVIWVGYNETPTTYGFPVNCTASDYRDLKYREVSTTSSKPTEMVADNGSQPSTLKPAVLLA